MWLDLSWSNADHVLIFVNILQVETKSGMAINCNDAGIRYRVAKANYPVPEGLPTESFQKLTKIGLGCKMNVVGKSTKDMPLMFVQVSCPIETRQVNCRPAA